MIAIAISLTTLALVLVLIGLGYVVNYFQCKARHEVMAAELDVAFSEIAQELRTLTEELKSSQQRR